MIIAITLRYDKYDDRELFTISKKFKDIFDELNVTLLPIFQDSNIEAICSICDALILTGSPIHINPKLYNQKAQINYVRPYDFEDSLDYKLIEIFNNSQKPILGICRGIQILNVYFGGTLNQNILNHENTKHKILINNNSFLTKIYSKETNANSSHSQSIKKLASNFSVAARSEDDIIEAIEAKNIWGVQWHPEKDFDKYFFTQFIEFIKVSKNEGSFTVSNK